MESNPALSAIEKGQSAPFFLTFQTLYWPNSSDFDNSLNLTYPFGLRLNHPNPTFFLSCAVLCRFFCLTKKKQPSKLADSGSENPGLWAKLPKVMNIQIAITELHVTTVLLVCHLMGLVEGFRRLPVPKF